MAGLFDPIQIRDMALKNRIVVSPMCMYSAGEDAVATDWHMVHYGSLALSGAALVIVEATAVEARGRISQADLGLYDEAQLPALRRIVEFAHNQGTKIGVQLAHAGRKADLPCEIVAPSAIAFSSHYQVPTVLSEAEMDKVVEAFQQAARWAVEVGFDCVELHGAHGYLLHQFLSPLSNQRTDGYGGSRDNRLRFPLRVVRAVREAVPDSLPVWIRVSGSEYSDDGYTMEDMIAYCQAFEAAGIDAIDVSSGGNILVRPPAVYAGYQVPLAESIKQAVHVPVVSVGLLDNPVLADSVIQSGRADLVAIARGFLRNKTWAHDAALALGKPVQPPVQYARAYPSVT